MGATGSLSARAAHWLTSSQWHPTPQSIVDRALGLGLLESVYEVVLAYELEKRGLKAVRQLPIPIEYDSMTFEEGFRGCHGERQSNPETEIRQDHRQSPQETTIDLSSLGR